MNLPPAWEQIQRGGILRDRVFNVLPASVSTSSGPVLYALDGEGRPHLLLPVPADALFTLDQQSAGVQLHRRALEDGPTLGTFADLVCLKPHLVELFARLCEDVLLAVQGEPEYPVGAVKKVLNRWRELLDRERSGLLDTNELAGLFGELYILEQLCSRDPGAVRAWNGPLKAKHDFMRDSYSLEIKTTITPNLVIVVHGVDQLESEPGGTLHLAVLSLGLDIDGTISVPTMLQRVREHSVDALELTNRLGAIGYYDHDAAAYNSPRFSVRETAFFRVGDSFPRIVRASFSGGDVPPGVRNLSYVVDLTTVSVDRLTGLENAAVLARLAEQT